LRYSSDQVPGRADTRDIRVPLCTPGAHPSDIWVSISLAGQEVDRHFSGCPTAPYVYRWDGKDGAGNIITGRTQAVVTIGYGYHFVYKRPAGSGTGAAVGLDFVSSFARFGTGTLFTRAGAVASRPELSYIQQRYTKYVEYRDRRSEGLGGWGLAQLASYDSETRTLTTGDGRVVSATNPMSSVIATVAGTGFRQDSAWDGPATDTPVGVVRGVASGADGTIYFADTTAQVVRKITPSGELVTIAGGNPDAPPEFEGPALQAGLAAPWDCAVAPDGSVYIADAGDNLIRRVSPTGQISIVAGGGSPADGLGDGADARRARLFNPRGIALTPEGSVYISASGRSAFSAGRRCSNSGTQASTDIPARWRAQSAQFGKSL